MYLPMSFFQSIPRSIRKSGVYGALALTGLLGVAGAPAHAQIVVQNASFEDNSTDFGNYPGYIDGNAPITGWTTNNIDQAGLNNATTGYAFVTTSALPDGPTVAFLQSFSSADQVTLSQDLNGFVIGQQYTVSFYAAGRDNYIAPHLDASLGGVDLFSQDIQTVSDNEPFTLYTSNPFTATSTAATLTFSAVLSGVATNGDGAVVLDGVKVNGMAGAAAPEPGSCTIALAGMVPISAGWTYRRRRLPSQPVA